MDEKFTREIVTVTQTNVSDEDKEVSAAFNSTAMKALRFMNNVLDFGPFEAKMVIARGFITATARLSAIDTKSEVETHRVAFDNMMREMTYVDEVAPLVTPDELKEIHVAPTTTSAQQPHN